MSLLRRRAAFNASMLAKSSREYFCTAKALVPMSAIFSSTYALKPSIRDTTTITVATPKITPSSVKNDLSLWLRIAEIASLRASRNGITGNYSGPKRILQNLSERGRLARNLEPRMPPTAGEPPALRLGALLSLRYWFSLEFKL